MARKSPVPKKPVPKQPVAMKRKQRPAARTKPAAKPKPAARVRPVAKAARLPRKAPVESERQYLLGRRIEDVAAAFVSMTQEVWVVKDRLAVLEHVLEKHGIPAPQLVDTLAPEPTLQTQLAAARRAWVERMIGALFPHGLPKVD